jgi:hypothetical protein
MRTARLRAQKKQNAAVMPSAAEKGVRGLPRLRYNTTRPRAKQAKCSEPGKAIPVRAAQRAVVLMIIDLI